tara:strand:- start:91923 stop:92084 length:162 start_codon:yes stop_codon:yes gene_type:complete
VASPVAIMENRLSEFMSGIVSFISSNGQGGNFKRSLKYIPLTPIKLPVKNYHT